jgi:hypothetical protein
MKARTRRRLGLVASFGLVGSCLAAGAYAVVSGAIGPSPGPIAGSMSGMSMGGGAMGMIGTTMSASSCQLLSPSAIDAALGRLVGAPHAATTDLMARCTYGIHGTPNAVAVTYTMRVLPDSFEKHVSSMAVARGASSRPCNVSPSVRCEVVDGGPASTTALLLHRGMNQVVIVAPSPPSRLELLARILAPSM